MRFHELKEAYFNKNPAKIESPAVLKVLPPCSLKSVSRISLKTLTALMV